MVGASLQMDDDEPTEDKEDQWLTDIDDPAIIEHQRRELDSKATRNWEVEGDPL
jgi:hypothetical protein